MSFFSALNDWLGAFTVGGSSNGIWNDITGNNYKDAAQQLAEDEFAETKRHNAWSEDFDERQFQYQQDYDANKYQIGTADAMKAGLNPLATSGLGGSSSAGVSASGGSPMPSAPSAGSGLAGSIGQLLGSMMSANASTKNAQLNSETQKNVADINAQAQKNHDDAMTNQAQIYADAARYSADQQFAATQYKTVQDNQASMERLKKQLANDRWTENMREQYNEYITKIVENIQMSENERNRLNELKIAKTQEHWRFAGQAINALSSVLSGLTPTVAGQIYARFNPRNAIGFQP